MPCIIKNANLRVKSCFPRFLALILKHVYDNVITNKNCTDKIVGDEEKIAAELKKKKRVLFACVRERERERAYLKDHDGE